MAKKKWICGLLIAGLTVSLTAGCSGDTSDEHKKSDGTSQKQEEVTPDKKYDKPSKYTVTEEETKTEENDIKCELNGTTLRIYGTGKITGNVMKDDLWFNNKEITEIIIDEGITGIGGKAFHGSVNVEKITFPKSLREVESQAFFSTKYETALKARTDLVIENSVVLYGANLSGNVVIPDGITCIAGDAFAHRTSGVITEYNNDITGIEIPESVEYIGAGAFSGTGITSVKLPSKLSEISPSLFEGSKIASITIPGSVKSIGDRAFAQTPMESIVIPEGVEIIYNEAFEEAALKSIELPESLRKIHTDVFRDTPLLEEKRAENPLVILGEFLIDGQTAKGSVTVPKEAAIICEYAFRNNDDLTEVIFSDGVQRVDESVFWECDNLKSITIPDSVKNFEKTALSISTTKMPTAVLKCKKNSAAAVSNNSLGAMKLKVEYIE